MSNEATINMATRSEVENFCMKDLCDFLSGKLADVVEDHHDIIRELRRNKIKGWDFIRLTDEELRELIAPIGDCKALKSIIEAYSPQPEVYIHILCT